MKQDRPQDDTDDRALPASLNFAVMGSVILIGVVADQQFGAFRERRRTQDAARRAAVEQPAE